MRSPTNRKNSRRPLQGVRVAQALFQTALGSRDGKARRPQLSLDLRTKARARKGSEYAGQAAQFKSAIAPTPNWSSTQTLSMALAKSEADRIEAHNSEGTQRIKESPPRPGRRWGRVRLQNRTAPEDPPDLPLAEKRGGPRSPQHKGHAFGTYHRAGRRPMATLRSSAAAIKSAKVGNIKGSQTWTRWWGWGEAVDPHEMQRAPTHRAEVKEATGRLRMPYIGSLSSRLGTIESRPVIVDTLPSIRP